MNNQLVDGKTMVYGVIGNPIEHTKSPFIHSLFAKYTGLNMAYMPFQVAEDNVCEAINGAKALNIRGLNVTVPHKKAVMETLDEIDELAMKIGAVNTIHFVNDKKIGYNTDIFGLARDMKGNDIIIKDEVVAILGAGGAANAIAFMAASEGAKKVYIVNRTLEKAERLQKQLQQYYDLEVQALSYDAFEELRDIDVCIQTTSVGMHPNVDRSPVSNTEIFANMKAAVDIIYNPPETKFLQDAKAHGVKTLNGLGMLYYQGLEAFEIWNGIKINEEIVKMCYNEFRDYVYDNK